MLPLTQRRLLSQRLIGDACNTIADVVAWLGAVQAQDYALAKWALGMRVIGASDDDVERAFEKGTILRTHVLRPTWHFVTPADIRWLLALTAPRVHQRNALLYRRVEIDSAVRRRCNAALAKALRNDVHLQRDELRIVLHRAGIRTDGDARMSYLLMQAELDGLICSGPRRGKQFTYALLDNRAPSAKAVNRRDALVELTRRFFSSHGPATPQDFAKWSGLTVTETRLGLEGAGRALASEVIDGQRYWFDSRAARAPRARSSTAHLLSIYDEYLSGYKDRRAIIDVSHAARLRALGAALTAIVIVDGRVAGTWKRRVEKKAIAVTTDLFDRVTTRQQQAVNAAISRFVDFYKR